MHLLFFIVGMLSLVGFSFATYTSANASGGGYSALTDAVKDFYSKEVLFAAQPKCKFLQFAKVKRELEAVKGKSIEFLKYGNLSGGGEIDEDAPIVAQALSSSTVTITVKEQVNAVTLTELLLRTSLHDVLEDASVMLADNVATVIDKQFRDVCLTTTNVVYGNGATSSSAMTAGSIFNTRTIKDCVELLAMANAPKFLGEYYVCFAHPKQLRQVRDDSNWINTNQYMGRRQIYVGEVGMYEGVIFIETTNMPYLTSSQVVTKYGGSFTPAMGCEAVVFGENAYAWAIALDLELRDDGITELGRKRTIGWYGIWGMGLIEEDNIIKVLSAAL